MAARVQTNGGRPGRADLGMRELVKELSHEVSTLVRQEVELARLEMSEKGKQAGMGAGLFGAGAVAALLMLGSLTAVAILALDVVMPAWAAALIVTALWAAAAAACALLGRGAFRQMGTPVPETTVQTVKEDVQWLRNRS